MQRKLVGAVLGAILMAIPAFGIAATMAGANTVNSAAIVDGAIATVDIANGAVTGAKMAIGTVTATQLANGAVTAAKLGITCPTGQYLQYTGTTWACSAGTAGPQGLTGPQGPQGVKGDTGLTGPQGTAGPQGPQGVKGDTGATGAQGPAGIVGTGTVTTNNLADGAVTDAKISGLISAAKLAGVIGVEKLGTYASVKIVHKGPADGVNTFNKLTDAILNVPGYDKYYYNYQPTNDRYAIIVMPGTYEEDYFQNSAYWLAYYYSANRLVDIIGASKTGSVIKPNPDQYGNTRFWVTNGMNLENLTILGTLDMSEINGDLYPLTSMRPQAKNIIITPKDHNDTPGTVAPTGLAVTLDSIVDNIVVNGPVAVVSGYANTGKVTNVLINSGADGISVSAPSKPYQLSNITVNTTKAGGSGVFVSSGTANMEKLTVNSSGGYVFGAVANGGALNCNNCSFNSSGVAVDAVWNGRISLTNSIVNGYVTAGNGGTVNLANTQITSPSTNFNGTPIKTFSCYDENFDPIQNGIH
jgi:hypothetical protein